MSRRFDWPALKNDLQFLAEQKVSHQNVTDFAKKLDHLEALLYEEQSQLERESYARPNEPQARKALNDYLLNVKAESSVMINLCASRIEPYFDSLPDELKPCLKPFIFRVKFGDNVQNLLAKAAAKSNDFSEIQSSVIYSYDDDSNLNPLAYRGSTDTDTRKAAHLATLKSEIKVKDKNLDLFRELHQIRTEAALQAEYQNYLEMAWQSDYMAERDYGLQDVGQLRQQVKTYACPLLVKIRGYRARLLKMPTLAPWDAVIGLGGQSLKLNIPEVNSALDEIGKVLGELSPEILSAFIKHREAGMYSVASANEPYLRPYSNYLPISDLSWLTCWYSNSPETTSTLIHEIGHTIHRSMIGPEKLFRQHFPAIEYSEFVPQFLEVICLPKLTAFYGSEDLHKAQILLLEKALSIMVYRSMMDEFQEKIYSITDISQFDLEDLYLTLLKEYPDGIDYSCVNRLNSMEWVNWHIFMHPFYGIEYTIAWYAALKWLGREKPKEVNTIFSRCQDAPTRQIFRELGVSIMPSNTDFGAWAAALEEHLEQLIKS